MLILILGLVIFLGMHSFTMMRDRRQAAIGKLGEGG
ncbi:MAG TPA: NnrU family protein, partial [Saliniramus sp.]|nr:NnrU family protein [Saliniramus sp.]